MKKIAAILLLIIYGSTSVGATIHLHYCMNEFVGWNLWHSDKDNECGKCGMTEKKGGCCKDEYKQVKLKTDHQKSAIAHYFKILDAPALITPTVTLEFKETLVSLSFPGSNAPPKIPIERLYILHCIFLI